MVGCELSKKTKKSDWLDTLLHSKFFGSCGVHQDLRKNEKNVFCIDCNLRLCRHCMKAHCHHTKLQICKYVYHDVIRLQEIQKHVDCARIQTYKINGDKAVHLNPRPMSKDAKPSTKAKFGSACDVCGRYLQDMPNRFCSIACKASVESVKPKHKSQDFITFGIPECGGFSPQGNNCSETYMSEMESSLSSEDMNVWAPVDNVNQGIGEAPQSAVTPNSTTINVSDVRKVKTIKVGNIARTVSASDFFSFSGEIKYVEMQSETEHTQLSYVTFNDAQGADTALLLTGATIANMPVTIAPAKEYQLPPEALIPSSPLKRPAVTSSAVEKAEDVVSTIVAKGFVLGKDAISKAKAFDEQHNLSSKASATVATIDQKISLMEKLSMGKAVVNEKVKQMDERFLVSEKTKTVFAVAEQKASSAGSAILSNPYVWSGASWVSTALGAFAKATEDVTTKTKEKVVKAEEEKQQTMLRQRTSIIDDYAQNHLDEPSGNEPPVVQTKSADDTNTGLV
ncbi:hypothetical protein ACLB2K_036330 [Fragaria x ananassa]